MNGKIKRWSGFTMLIMTIGVILVSACGPAATTQPPPTPTMGPLDVVNAYEKAQNSHDIPGTIVLFSEDASFLDSFGKQHVSREKIQKLLEYFEGMNAEFHFSNCQISGSSVTCDHTVSDDCMKANGVNPVPGTTTFMLTNDKIKNLQITYTESPESKASDEFFSKYIAWFGKNYPSEWASISESDESLFTRESGATLTKGCAEYAEGQE